MSRAMRDADTTARPRKPPRAGRAVRVLADAAVGQVVTLRVMSYGPLGGGVFVRAVHPDGSESEPTVLPADWPVEVEP